LLLDSTTSIAVNILSNLSRRHTQGVEHRRSILARPWLSCAGVHYNTLINAVTVNVKGFDRRFGRERNRRFTNFTALIPLVSLAVRANEYLKQLLWAERFLFHARHLLLKRKTKESDALRFLQSLRELLAGRDLLLALSFSRTQLLDLHPRLDLLHLLLAEIAHNLLRR
jgi:hypothetical protein